MFSRDWTHLQEFPPIYNLNSVFLFFAAVGNLAESSAPHHAKVLSAGSLRGAYHDIGLGHPFVTGSAALGAALRLPVRAGGGPAGPAGAGTQH